MKIALLIIGSEILSGRTQDKNIQNAALVLRSKGLSLSLVLTIKDDQKLMQQKMHELMEDFDVIITSGGLGPTRDDLTKQVMAEVAQGQLAPHETAKALVEVQYKKFGREWTPETNSYHLIPSGVMPLANPVGLAPGLLYQDKLKAHNPLVICLPGVPREFSEMLDQIVLPILAKHPNFPKQNINYITLRTAGVPEEQIFFKLSPGLWNALEEFGEVSSLPHLIGVDIVIKLLRPLPFLPEEVKQQILNLSEMAPLLPFIWWVGDQTPEQILQIECKRQQKTIAVAESCTGGKIASSITSLPGASDIFLGGLVTYSNQLKNQFLGVKEETLRSHGAVSKEVAHEMALGCIQSTGADFAISTTGHAGPDNGNDKIPVGTIFIGMAKRKQLSQSSENEIEVQVKEYHFRGDRKLLQDRFSARALVDLIQFAKF